MISILLTNKNNTFAKIMKLLSYKLKQSGKEQIGVLHENMVFNLNTYFGDISLIQLIQIEDFQEKIASQLVNKSLQKIDRETIVLLPPVSPHSFRDAYSFKQHVETSRKNRGLSMIKEFDEFPVFYFSNPHTVYADEAIIELMPDHFEKLDYELEFAIVIGKGGKNILSKDADKHIAGFCILNDLSARTLQMEEMQLNLGPAKGKDFASILGPYLVTPDELDTKSIDTPFGKKYDLKMQCYVNGELLSEGNAKEMNWTFAEIIERASYGAELYPGDVIGSGTVGTGCFLELNGTEIRKNPNYKERWLQPEDQIIMQVDGLGKISNKIVKSNSNHSILKLKK